MLATHIIFLPVVIERLAGDLVEAMWVGIAIVVEVGLATKRKQWHCCAHIHTKSNEKLAPAWGKGWGGSSFLYRG